MFLDHTPTIQLSSGDVWQEQVPASMDRSFAKVAHPIEPPGVPSGTSDSMPKSGISVLSYNCDGSLIATKDDSTPFTIWIWDVEILTPRAVLIFHAPVKMLSWHPKRPGLLLVHCSQDTPIIYVWDSVGNEPAIFPISVSKGLGRVDFTWLESPPDCKPAILLGSQSAYALVWPFGREQILRFEHPDSPEKDESEDSLYDILTGRTPIPPLDGRSASPDEPTLDDDSGALEDTFRGKRAPAATSTAMSDESFF